MDETVSGVEPRTVPDLIRLRARTHADKTALTFETTSFSYVQVDQISDAYANAFLDRGLRRHDHAAIFLTNRPEFLWVSLALAKIGAVAVPLNIAARGLQLSYYLTQSDSRWVITESSLFGHVISAIPETHNFEFAVATDVDACAATPTGFEGIVHHLQDFENAPTTPVIVEHDPADLQALNYTSGTTGPSKAAMSPYGQPIAVARLVAEELGYRDTDILYTCLPLFHVNALWYTCAAAYWAGAEVHLDRTFSASAFWPRVAAGGATIINLLGAIATILLKAPPSEVDTRHQVRQALIAPINPQMVEQFEGRFGACVTSLYAATETFPVTILPPGRPSNARLDSAGRESSLGEICVAGPDGTALAPESLGEILVRPRRPAAMMQGYYNKPEETRTVFADLWFHTGDRGYIDQAGYLVFVDRIKEVIRRRGENISSFEVESALLAHPSIKEVAAVPVSSELTEDEVMLFVVLQPDIKLTESEVIEFAAENMARFMVPRFIRFVDDLPRTPSQKIEKYKLREWAREHRPSLWDREQHGIEVPR